MLRSSDGNNNRIRMAILERKIEETRGRLAQMSAADRFYNLFKGRLNSYVTEYQERQLMEEQLKKYGEQRHD